ncbi:MAG: cation transporter [Bacteroidetes bacterium]|nr:cation transporter [Bacteroidota bacterium]
MKKLIAITLLLTCFGLTSFAQGKKKTEEISIKTSAVCGMCKNSLEKAMAYEKGVKKSSLDKESQVLTVVYNPKKTDAEKIRKAITEVGYDADEMSANPKAYENLNECCKKDNKVH